MANIQKFFTDNKKTLIVIASVVATLFLFKRYAKK